MRGKRNVLVYRGHELENAFEYLLCDERVVGQRHCRVQEDIGIEREPRFFAEHAYRW